MELIGDGTTLLESYPVKKKFRGRNKRQHFPKIIFIFKIKFTKQKCTKCSNVIPVASEERNFIRKLSGQAQVVGGMKMMNKELIR